MAVPEQVPYKEYIGNGVTKSFPLTFDCDSKDKLIVTIDGVAVYFPKWSFFDGVVKFETAPESESEINIRRKTKFERETDYQTYNNSLTPKALNKDFDLLWWVIQELDINDTFISFRVNELKDYVDQQDDSLGERIENLKKLILREESFLEIVASTSFPEPDIIFGAYVAGRTFQINTLFPNIATCVCDIPVSVSVFKNDEHVGAIHVSNTDSEFSQIRFIKGKEVFERGDRITLKLETFHYSLKMIAVTLIGRFPYYDLYDVG